MSGYFDELSKVFEERGSNRLTEELKRVVGELKRLSAREAKVITPASVVYTRSPERQIDMDALLELKPLIRAGVQSANGTYKSERHFFDFVVNGQSLWDTLGKRHDMVSILCAEHSADETEKAVNRLLLREKADLPNDRRSVFVCSECGDLECGAITALVDKQGETITWKTFGYENTYEDKIGLDDYSTVGPFMFNAVSYERTLVQAMARLRRAVR